MTGGSTGQIEISNDEVSRSKTAWPLDSAVGGPLRNEGDECFYVDGRCCSVEKIRSISQTLPP